MSGDPFALEKDLDGASRSAAGLAAAKPPFVRTTQP